MRTDLFVSYSHKDRRYQERLVTQLRVLEKAGKHRLRVWSDQQISPGGDWQEAIDTALTSAASAVLLVSANFLTSNFILQREIPAILKRHQEAGLRVFPVIATPCAWRKVDWLARLQFRPRNGKPVWRSGGRYADEELARLVEEIADLMSNPGSLAPPMEDEIQAEDPIPGMDDDLLPMRPVSLAEVAEVLQAAISKGVPLFNSGRMTECASIYLQTAQRLIERIERGGCDVTIPVMRSPISMLSGLELYDPLDLAGCPVAARILEAATVPAPILDSKHAGEVAWSLRHAFDQILLIHESLSTLTGLARKVLTRRNAESSLSSLAQKVLMKGRESSLTSPVRKVLTGEYPDYETIDLRAFGNIIHRALMLGDHAYLTGRENEQHWWDTVAAIYYHAVRHAASFIDDDMEAYGVLDEVLVPLVHDPLYRTRMNEGALCWELRYALLRLLPASH
jgi:hypothetical protein